MVSASYGNVLKQLRAMELEYFNVLLEFIEGRGEVYNDKTAQLPGFRKRKAKPKVLSLPEFVMSLKNNLDDLKTIAEGDGPADARAEAIALIQSRNLAFNELIAKTGY